MQQALRNARRGACRCSRTTRVTTGCPTRIAGAAPTSTDRHVSTYPNSRRQLLRAGRVLRHRRRRTVDLRFHRPAVQQDLHRAHRDHRRVQPRLPRVLRGLEGRSRAVARRVPRTRVRAARAEGHARLGAAHRRRADHPPAVLGHARLAARRAARRRRSTSPPTASRSKSRASPRGSRRSATRRWCCCSSTASRRRPTRRCARQIRKKCACACSRASTASACPCSSPMTLARGVSEREIAWVVRQGVRHRNVRLVAMLPAFFSGRFDIEHDPLDRITLSDVVKGVTAGLTGQRARRGFSAHSLQSSELRLGDAVRAPLRPVRQHRAPRRSQRRDERRGLQDRARPAAACRTSSARGARTGSSAPPRALARKLVRPRDVFGIVVKPFMDRYSYDQDRVSACCHHVLDTRWPARVVLRIQRAASRGRIPGRHAAARTHAWRLRARSRLAVISDWQPGARLRDRAQHRRRASRSRSRKLLLDAPPRPAHARGAARDAG